MNSRSLDSISALKECDPTLSNMIQVYPTDPPTNLRFSNFNLCALCHLGFPGSTPLDLPWLKPRENDNLTAETSEFCSCQPSHRRSMTFTAGESMWIQNPRNTELVHHALHTSWFFAQESCKSWVTDSSSTMSSIVHVHDQSNPIKSYQIPMLSDVWHHQIHQIHLHHQSLHVFLRGFHQAWVVAHLPAVKPIAVPAAQSSIRPGNTPRWENPPKLCVISQNSTEWCSYSKQVDVDVIM